VVTCWAQAAQTAASVPLRSICGAHLFTTCLAFLQYFGRDRQAPPFAGLVAGGRGRAVIRVRFGLDPAPGLVSAHLRLSNAHAVLGGVLLQPDLHQSV
jgi:hypothetical protein